MALRPGEPPSGVSPARGPGWRHDPVEGRGHLRPDDPAHAASVRPDRGVRSARLAPAARYGFVAQLPPVVTVSVGVFSQTSNARIKTATTSTRMIQARLFMPPPKESRVARYHATREGERGDSSIAGRGTCPRRRAILYRSPSSCYWEEPPRGAPPPRLTRRSHRDEPFLPHHAAHPHAHGHLWQITRSSLQERSRRGLTTTWRPPSASRACSTRRASSSAAPRRRGPDMRSNARG